MPELSIVIGTKNRFRELIAFTDSVMQFSKSDWELVIADASDEPTARSGRIRTVVENPPLGHIRGYNRAFRECKGEYVCWFNDDCKLYPNWDIQALDFMRANAEVGLGCFYFRDSAGRAPRSPFQVQSLNGLTYPNFGILRRTLGNDLGWFDETNLGEMYGADTDIGYRVLERGLEVVPIPGSQVLHYRTHDASRAHSSSCYPGDRAKFDAKWNPRLRELLQSINLQRGKCSVHFGREHLAMPLMWE